MSFCRTFGQLEYIHCQSFYHCGIITTFWFFTTHFKTSSLITPTFTSTPIQVCLPCSSGFYRAPQDPHFRCIPCGYWSFQPKIGQTTCIRCLHYGFSYSDHSDSSLNCIAIYYSWQFVLVVSEVVGYGVGERKVEGG